METERLYYLGVVKNIIEDEDNGITKEYGIIEADIPGVIQGIRAFPKRNELNEPKPGDAILLLCLDPILNSYWIYERIKENDFIGIRAAGKMIDITPDYISIGIFDKPYSFMSNVGSARFLVAFMNFLMWFGNTTILLLAGMLGIDTTYYEAAEVDGATATQIFFRITLPILRPIMIFVMITSLIGGLQMFDVPQILTNGEGSPTRTTMTLIMYLNKHLYSKNFGMGGALSVMLFIITGILSLIVFKFNQQSEK